MLSKAGIKRNVGCSGRVLPFPSRSNLKASAMVGSIFPLDALRSIADGLKVSIDWLLGRIDERFAPEFTTEDYALFCQSVVLRLLDEVVTNAAKNPEAHDADKLTINDVPISDISAAAILDFIHIVERQKGNSNRPSGYGVEQIGSIAGSANSKGLPQHVEGIPERKL